MYRLHKCPVLWTQRYRKNLNNLFLEQETACNQHQMLGYNFGITDLTRSYPGINNKLRNKSKQWKWPLTLMICGNWLHCIWTYFNQGVCDCTQTVAILQQIRTKQSSHMISSDKAMTVREPRKWLGLHDNNKSHERADQSRCLLTQISWVIPQNSYSENTKCW